MVPLGQYSQTGTGVTTAGRTTLSVVPKKSKTPYSDALANVTEQQQAYYNESYRPVAQGLIADTKSTAIVDAAVKEASVDNTAAINARRSRQKARLGVATAGTDKSLGAYSTSMSRTLQSDGAVNEARVQQGERNDALVDDLVGISRGISADALNGMQTATANESSRNSTNASIKAQNSAARTSMLGSAAGLALMFLI